MAYEGERKLASICRISEITPIEGADRIEVAHIHGWKIVVGKNEFKVGDLVVYFEIDSYLPVEERYEFLRGRCFRVFKQHEKVFREGFRIKTCKLRGVISQGLVMPLSAFPEITDAEEGANVTQLLNIDHYDEVAAPFLPVSIPCGDKLRDFPSYIPKSDEERCVAGNTIIETNKGKMAISEIVNCTEPLLIKSYNCLTGDIEFKPLISRSRQNAIEGWYKLTISDGTTIKCTGNHKIYLPSLGVYREVKQLMANEIIIKNE